MMSAAAAIFFFSVKRNFVNIISGGGSGSVQRKKMTLKEERQCQISVAKQWQCAYSQNSIGLLLHKLNITKTTRFDKITLKRYIIFFLGVNEYEDFINVVV